MTNLLPNPTFLPKKPFFEGNRSAINAIFRQINIDFPETGAVNVLNDEEPQPSPEAMNWMWQHFMGRQHGTLEGLDSKIPLFTADQPTYRALIDELHYGPYGFTEASLADPNTHYTNSLILGGLPQEMSSRLRASLGEDPRLGNVEASTLLTGQRLRWRQALGERSIFDIYNVIAEQTGVDIDKLREQSPWIRQEEKKRYDENNPWSGPYATEFELGRLSAEAYFHNLIDWKNYDVDVAEDPTSQEQSYIFQDKTHVVPPRTDAFVTYELTNGTKVNILNAIAVPRDLGVPRPTSDSQTREAVALGLLGREPETLSFAVSPPHLRAGIDIFVRLLERRINIVHAEIVNHAWLEDKELITALGEIPATHKADLRLRAVLSGQDPDAPALAQL